MALSQKADFERCMAAVEQIFDHWQIIPIVSVQDDDSSDDEFILNIEHPTHYHEAADLFLAFVQGFQFFAGLTT